MQTKVYFANSVPAAIEAAREELGPDALLINSKPSPPEGRDWGCLEVTFAYDPRTARNEANAPHESAAANRAIAPGSELEEIRRQLSALRIAVGRARNGDSENGAQDDPIAGRLQEAGFDADSARTLSTGIRSENDALRMLTSKIPVTPFVAMQPGESRTIAFVGPPGRGKTTSLVKLAIGHGLAHRVPVRIYSMGEQGVGALEQMVRFAAILGVPHQSFESIESLALALAGDTSWKGLSLIDTPGLSASDHHEIRDFGRFFANRPGIETNLVLRAEGRSADHLNMIARFSGFKVSRVLFTGTDEMPAPGAMIETLIRANILTTFVGTGPQIPDGLEEIDAGRFVRAIFSRDVRERRFALAAA